MTSVTRSDIVDAAPADRLLVIDATRIGLFGWSRGSMMSFLALKRGLGVRAAAVGGVVSDLHAGLRHRPEGDVLDDRAADQALVHRSRAVGDGLPRAADLLADRSEAAEDQLADAMVMFSSAIRAGLSIPQALELLAVECPAPIKQEFHQISGEYKLGKPLERTLEEAKDRKGPDAKDTGTASRSWV